MKLIFGGVAAMALIGYISFDATKTSTEQKRKHKIEVSKTYQLSSGQDKFMRACANDLSHYNLGFKGLSNNISGCGCIAEKLPASLMGGDAPADYAIAIDIFKTAVRSVKSDIDIASEYTEISTRYNASVSDVSKLSLTLLSATEYCGLGSNTRADDRAANPEKYAEQDAAEAAKEAKRLEKCKSFPEDLHKRMEQRETETKRWNRQTCQLEYQ